MTPVFRPPMLAWSLAAGLALGVLYTASPLLCWTLALLAVGLRVAGVGLPAEERRLLVTLLLVAFAARLAVVAAMAVAGMPTHNALAVGALSGDEAYYLSRALRTRDVLLGLAPFRYDHFIAFDEYGRSSYLGFLTLIQLLFGPTPYSLRALNAVVYLAGAVVLFHLARRAYGPVPAFGGLLLLLFLPSLFYSSITLLKEPVYFLTAAVLVSTVVWAIRARDARRAGAALVLTALSLWLLDDLRRGALIIAVAGLSGGLGVRVALSSRRAALAASLVAVAGVVALLTMPAVQQRAVQGVEAAATLQGGHVFTVGHAYKLLDDGFYARPWTAASAQLGLTPPQALRFVVRGVYSFVVTPLPWEMRSIRELAFLPEHIVWYGLVALLPVGLVAGWQRDPLLTSVLAGLAASSAVVVALTTGNVGTLLRLRGLVTPFIVWLSVLGLCVLLQASVARRNRGTQIPRPWAAPGAPSGSL